MVTTASEAGDLAESHPDSISTDTMQRQAESATYPTEAFGECIQIHGYIWHEKWVCIASVPPRCIVQICIFGVEVVEVEG